MKKKKTTTTTARIHGGEATPPDQCHGAHVIVNSVFPSHSLWRHGPQPVFLSHAQTKTTQILQMLGKICSAGNPVLWLHLETAVVIIQPLRANGTSYHGVMPHFHWKKKWLKISALR